MNQDQTVDTSVLEQINAVEGFDPRPFAVDYTDLGTGQTRKRLPVMIQMAWFRLRYPEGKISVEVTQGAARTSPLSPRVSGRRRQLSASHCAMRASASSSPPRARISAVPPRMSSRWIW